MELKLKTPSHFEINSASNTLIIDSVTFCFDFAKGRIKGGHHMGPVFELNSAMVVLTEQQASELVQAGVSDDR